jgi:hypothetical protein
MLYSQARKPYLSEIRVAVGSVVEYPHASAILVSCWMRPAFAMTHVLVYGTPEIKSVDCSILVRYWDMVRDVGVPNHRRFTNTLDTVRGGADCSGAAGTGPKVMYEIKACYLHFPTERED